MFLDRFHHAKEKFLFPAAAEECPKVAETLTRLKKEHAQARRMMKNALKSLDEGDVPKAEKEARKLVDHMTVHISEEENQVFPVIENCLQLETDAKIHVQYERFMEKEFGRAITRWPRPSPTTSRTACSDRGSSRASFEKWRQGGDLNSRDVKSVAVPSAYGRFEATAFPD